jgi:putative copper export protein
MTFWNGVLWVHLLSMAFFVGGQLMLAGIVVPVLRTAPDRTPLRAAARRFGWGTVIALALLIITGSMMAAHEHKWSDSTLHVKLGFVALVVVLIGAHVWRPEWHAIDAVLFLVSVTIVWLGIVVAG